MTNVPANIGTETERFHPRITRLIKESWAAHGYTAPEAGAVYYAFASGPVMDLTEAQYSSLIAERLIIAAEYCEDHAVEIVGHQRAWFAKCHAEIVDLESVWDCVVERL